MAIIPVAFRVASAADLETALNAALAPLINTRLLGIEIDQVRQGVFSDRNIYACLCSDTGGATAVATPFQAKVFSHSDEGQVLTLFNQFIAANPSYFISPLFVTYRPTVPNPDQFVIGVMFYNTTAAASANWGGGGSGASGPAGADLSGFFPNPTVIGIQGKTVSNIFPAGGQLTFDATSGTLVWYVIRNYATAAAMVADQATQIIGQVTVVIADGLNNGTYQLNVKTGHIGDYTKLSSSSVVASGVALDAAIPPLSATDVFAALQQIVALTINPTSTGTAGAGVTTIASVPLASVGRVDWEVLLERGASRYIESLHYTHDGSTPFGGSDDIYSTTFPFNATLAAVVVGANLELQCTNAGAALAYRVRAKTLPI